MTKKSDAPAIRFKGFSDAWEQRKLGELVDVCSGRDYKHLSEGTIPVYGTGGYMLSVNDALSYDRDAIGIGRKGTIDRPYILKAPFWTVDTLFYAIPREKVDLNYAFDIFQNIDWKKKDESTGVPSLSKTAINDIYVLAPKHDEQQIIGQFFAAIDNLITLHQRKFEKLTNVKKSMLEKMFPQNGSSYPEIRFKGFTDPWEQRKLGDVVKEITRNDPESEAPIMMITANNGFIEQSERYAFNNAGESLKKYILLKKGELAYNHGASKLRPYGSCFALTTAENARIPFVYHCFSAENQNAEFMSIELNGAEIENQLRKIVSSGARMDGLLNISFDEYTSVSVLLPGTEEQDCIADFFRQLDNLITLHQRKFEKLTNVKKSMLEKMFPQNGSSYPEIRFKGFTDPWEQRKLGDVVKEITRNDPESEAPIMMITANNGFIEQSERYAFNNAGESLKKYILLKKGELAYNHGASKLRPYGSCFALTTAENARIPFVYHCFSAENQNAEFMSIELNGAEIENQLRKIVSSGARMDGLLNISFDEYTSVSVLLPGTEEQDCIADFFRQLDNLITLHQRELEKLQNIKKSMLEKMFV